jgi:hypothetical protein
MDREQAKKKARAIVRRVLDDILDRRGFRQTWDGCDEQIKKEIRDSLRRVTENELMKKGD